MKELTKEELIVIYTKTYKRVHGTKPKGLDLYDWDTHQLQLGLKILEKMEKR